MFKKITSGIVVTGLLFSATGNAFAAEDSKVNNVEETPSVKLNEYSYYNGGGGNENYKGMDFAVPKGTDVESLNENRDTYSTVNLKQEIAPRVLPIPRPQLTAGWRAAIKIVKDTYGHLFTAELMEIALNPPSSSQYYNDTSRAAKLINESDIFKTKVLKANAKKFNKKSTTNIKGSEAFTAGELHTALNKFNYDINVQYNASKGKYYYYGYITDVYDFEWNSYNRSYKNFSVTFANNYANECRKMGIIGSYNVRIFVNGFY
ncbi:hypothetical protein [Bacillus wiedmannii]|uniref:hypothetical protein n=1 Tax=Bacillus wiedmannii TaxID=1890302 RepID=UPI000BFA0E17|nr:hypothetical protein [Bacillus wiedmannii]PGA32059.1 hypothetical protein COL74_18795 [Bacillus wiedmannii]PHB99412.1 hypothetical protein COE96_07465 [Bacillus wiedmannii]